MFRKSPIAIGWVVVFLAVPAAILFWELVRGTYNTRSRHIEHLIILIIFVRGLFELYGYLNGRRLATEDAGSV